MQHSKGMEPGKVRERSRATERRLARFLLTPRWIITTLLVIAACGVMVRLGIWQLDRLAQRRAFNAATLAQQSAPLLDLNQAVPDNLTGMEYRPVEVRGAYDPQNEVLLRNQVAGGAPGYHLLTPLKIAGSDQAVLVDRGFIPVELAAPAKRARFDQTGPQTLRGQIRLGHVPKYFGAPDPTLAPGQQRLEAWNAINLPRIAAQTPYALLPVYVELAPDPSIAATGQGIDNPNAAINSGASVLGGDSASSGPSLSPAQLQNLSAPVASLATPDLSEGPHMGYALQWFAFAIILGLGYPFFVRKQINKNNGKEE